MLTYQSNSCLVLPNTDISIYNRNPGVSMRTVFCHLPLHNPLRMPDLWGRQMFCHRQTFLLTKPPSTGVSVPFWFEETIESSGGTLVRWIGYSPRRSHPPHSQMLLSSKLENSILSLPCHSRHHLNFSVIMQIFQTQLHWDLAKTVLPSLT